MSRWQSPDAFFADVEQRREPARHPYGPPRPPSPIVALAADIAQEFGGVDDREFDALVAQLRSGLSSPDRGLVRREQGRREGAAVMSTDPGSFRIGPPPKREDAAPRPRRTHAGGRPLRAPIDSWLALSGWGGGKDAAGSITLRPDENPDIRRAKTTIRGQWRWELTCRGWDEGWLRRSWVLEGGVWRMYWWTTDKAPTVPPAAPAGGES